MGHPIPSSTLKRPFHHFKDNMETRYSAICRARIGNGFQTLNLGSDHTTRAEAMQAALAKFGPHAKSHIMVFSFTLPSEAQKAIEDDPQPRLQDVKQ